VKFLLSFLVCKLFPSHLHFEFLDCTHVVKFIATTIKTTVVRLATTTVGLLGNLTNQLYDGS